MLRKFRVAPLPLSMLGCLLGACRSHDTTDQPVVIVPARPTDKPVAKPVAKAPPLPVEIELLHHSEAKVAVSSVVANGTIYPSDLVDGKMSTAWNSRTGDLDGAWLAVRVPTAAHVTRIRMTVGFANLHHNDDWFRMNYRIRAVHVVRLGVDGDLGTHTFDPENPESQDIVIDGPGGDFKIIVTEVVPGTKPSWREICVSELEVWGSLPVNTPLRHGNPYVAVGSLDAVPLPDHDITLDPLPSFGSVDAFCKTYLARPPETFSVCNAMDDDCTPTGKASCGEIAKSPVVLGKMANDWTTTRYFYTTREHSQRKICNLALASGGKTYVLEGVSGSTCGEAAYTGVPDRTMTRAEISLHGDLIAITMTVAYEVPWNGGAELDDEQLWLCSASEPACTSAIMLGEYTTTRTGQGLPGADGLSVEISGWSFDWALDGKQLLLSHHDGRVPPEQRDHLGAHRLVMPDER